MVAVPSYLNIGDKIWLVSPAKKLDEQQVSYAIEVLTSWGLNVHIGANCFANDGNFAGTKTQRLSDLQSALNDKLSKAIICMRGGYGTMQLLPELDFTEFINHPKWIVGYSDVTALHYTLSGKLNTASIHGTMPLDILPEEDRKTSIESLRLALFGELKRYDFSPSKHNAVGSAAGFLVGGNLSIIHNMFDKSDFKNTRDKIVFIEEIDEPLYHVERMLLSLTKRGYFLNTKAVIIGGLTKIENHGWFRQEAEEVIKSALPKNIPIAFGFNAGHIKNNLALILNKQAKLEVQETNCRLIY